MSACTVTGLKKAYAGRTVLDIPILEIPEREFFVLVGPSGSGKTTLLRILAGLLPPTKGEVLLGGRVVTGVPPHKRGIGVVFQGLALWPHMSVRGNIALGLEQSVADAGERAGRIEEVSRELGIESYLGVRPHRLSGGERQRVALARALVRRPKLLLLDEPFSDLDARLRRSIARLVRDLHDEHGTTTLLITHDRTDAHLLADRIGVMANGTLLACDRPDRLHADPPSRFVAEFLTDAAILVGRIGADGRAETSIGPIPIERGPPAGSSILVAVRPDEVAVGDGPATGRVLACEFEGGAWRCRVRVGEEEVAVLNDAPLRAGQEIGLTPPTRARRPLEETA